MRLTQRNMSVSSPRWIFISSPVGILHKDIHNIHNEIHSKVRNVLHKKILEILIFVCVLVLLDRQKNKV